MNNDQDLFDMDDNVFTPNYVQTAPVTKAKLKTMTLLDKLERLIQLAQGCQLDAKFFKRHEALITSVASDLELQPVEAVMLCPFISDSESSVNTREMTQYFSCSPVTIMRKTPELKALMHRRYIRRYSSFRSSGASYQLTEKAKAAFINNQSLPIINTANLTAEAFMKHFNKLLRDVGRGSQIDEEELLYETIELINNNPKLVIARNINKLKVYDVDKLFLLYFCKRLVVDHQVGIPLDQLEFLVDDLDDFSHLMNSGRHPFITDGLLMLANRDDFFSRNLYSLTDKARAMLLSEYELPARDTEEDASPNSNVIHSTDIKPKPMYYCEDDEKQINTLFGLLEDKQLIAIRARLEQAKLRKGFNCLFYGLPGTGKTETALQLARATGRDIMQVDIASIRDKWYGETEKIVKSIFDNYAKLVKRSVKIPILLINEADAILSVRTGIGGSNPSIDKTENAIQNILLESMENIDGIMIATTNLTCNLDSAFDRRFLYKVEFHQPSVEAKTHIWKIFLPDLSKDDAMQLARAYDFSGGQIENIARKVLVDQLLFGGTPDLSRIEELCSKEQITGRSNGSRRPIGFNS